MCSMSSIGKGGYETSSKCAMLMQLVICVIAVHWSRKKSIVGKSKQVLLEGKRT